MKNMFYFYKESFMRLGTLTRPATLSLVEMGSPRLFRAVHILWILLCLFLLVTANEMEWDDPSSKSPFIYVCIFMSLPSLFFLGIKKGRPAGTLWELIVTSFAVWWLVLFFFSFFV
jgi:hypothetical protein